MKLYIPFPTLYSSIRKKIASHTLQLHAWPDLSYSDTYISYIRWQLTSIAYVFLLHRPWSSMPVMENSSLWFSSCLLKLDISQNSRLGSSVPWTFLLKSTRPKPKSNESYYQKSPLKVTKIMSKKAQNSGKNTSFYKKFQTSWKLGTLFGENSSFLRQKLGYFPNFLGNSPKLHTFELS